MKMEYSVLSIIYFLNNGNSFMKRQSKYKKQPKPTSQEAIKKH